MIFTAIGGLVAGSLFGLAAGTSAFALVSGLVSGGLAFGAKYLLGNYLNRQKRRSYSAVAGESQIGGAVPISTLYGLGKTSGHRLGYFKWGKGNKFNAEVFRLAHGWCDGLEPYVYFYGEKHVLVPRAKIGAETEHWGVEGFDNRISIRFYDGRPGQEADAKLVADTADLGQTWKATSRCTNMAYVVVERRWDADKFTKGRPSFDWVLRGLREYDPRKDSTVAGGDGAQRLNDPATWAYTANPAVHRLNYQLGLRGPLSGRILIGEGKSLGQLDLSSYFAAMNVCDTVRAGKPTYACGLWATSDDDHTEILKEFDDAMAGYAMNRRGLSGIIVGAPQVPVANLTDADIDAGRVRNLQHRKSSYDTYNQLSGQFTSIAKNWEAESLTPIVVNADVLADGKPRGTSNDFLQVTDPDIAQYLLQIRYRQNRKSGSATVPVSRRFGFAVEEGDWITWAGKTWLIKNWSADRRLRVTLTLAETGADVYASEGIIPGPIIVPAPPQINPSLASTVANFKVDVGMIAGDGYEKPVLLFRWDAPDDPTITAVRFEYQVEDAPEVFTTQMLSPEDGTYTAGDNVVPGKTYLARATIVTVPDRFKTWTPWAVTSTTTGSMAVKSRLKDLDQGVYATIQRLRADLDDAVARMEDIAGANSSATGTSIDLLTVSKVFQGNTATAMREVKAAISDENGNIVSVASILDAVRASVGLVSADGLFRMTAEAGGGDVVARLVAQVRATVDDAWVSAGYVIEAGFTGGDPELPFSRFIINAGQFVVTDGTNTSLPLVFEDGMLKLSVGIIDEAIITMFKTPTQKTRMGVFGADSEGIRIST